MTSDLLERGLAYEVDGNVYYDVSAFPAYGQLSGQRLDADAGRPPRRRRDATSAIPRTSRSGSAPSRAAS